MGSLGSADFKELIEFQKKLQQLEKDRAEFCERCSKALAGRLLRLVIDRTPVGQYEEDSGMVGGTLRRGWTGEKETSAAAYIKSLPIYKNGDYYTIVIKNPVEYASYVEFGHRTRGKLDKATGKWLVGIGWVNGRYMLTLSEKDLEAIAPAVLERELNKFFKEIFDE
ncbi:MAG: HK97 gp10 family phage protein [Clostridia bacterium]|nr:HK97 gp10 family phage protein [Clostridia bacterium]